MKNRGLWIGALLLLTSACSTNNDENQVNPTPPEPAEIWPEVGMEEATYINNGTIQLGVDMQRGGAVFHFSEVNTKHNVLNHCDAGRFVQQSYYGESDGSVWNGTPWVWNPIQAGGSHGEKARVLSSEVKATMLKVSSEPVHWASGRAISECVMSETISLDGRVAHIRYVLSNRGVGAKDHPSTDQEVPAVFVDWNLKNYVFYDGARPWTGDVLKSEVPFRMDLYPDRPNEVRNRTEHWAAYVDDSGWGIGVYTPGTERSTTYRFGSGPRPGTNTATDGSCSYFAPISIFGIEKGGVHTYDVYMMIGTTDEIRAAFYEIHKKSY
ncbi:MAG: hypothetical protein RRY33_06800 [Alistipes sp.]